jgi:hypothetical protein
MRNLGAAQKRLDDCDEHIIVGADNLTHKNSLKAAREAIAEPEPPAAHVTTHSQASQAPHSGH